MECIVIDPSASQLQYLSSNCSEAAVSKALESSTTLGNHQRSNENLLTRGSQDNDAKNIERKRQRLVELRHASMCPSGPNECGISSYCWQLKILWKHLLGCKNDECTTRLCLSSRYILTHYRNCRDDACEICSPVKNPLQRSIQMAININKRSNSHVSEHSSPPSPEHVPVEPEVDEVPNSKKIRTRTISEENGTLASSYSDRSLSSGTFSLSSSPSLSSSLSRQSTLVDTWSSSQSSLDRTSTILSTTTTLDTSMDTSLADDFDFLIEKLQNCKLLHEATDPDVSTEKKTEELTSTSSDEEESTDSEESSSLTVHPLISNGLFVLQHVQNCIQTNGQTNGQMNGTTTTATTTTAIPSGKPSRKCNWIVCQVMKRLLFHYELCSLKTIRQSSYCQVITPSVSGTSSSEKTGSSKESVQQIIRSVQQQQQQQQQPPRKRKEVTPACMICPKLQTLLVQFSEQQIPVPPQQQ